MTSLVTNVAGQACKNCGSRKDTITGGFVVCTNCGSTKDREYVDHLPVRRSGYEKSYSHNSLGKNLEFVGALGSNIGYSHGILRGNRGQKLNPHIVYKYRRLIRHHHDRARLEGNATHLRTMIAFNRIHSELQLSRDIKQRSLFLYWQIVKEDHKITNHVLLIALCLLQAVREGKSKSPVRFSEVVNTFAKNGHRVTNKNILRLARELNMPLSPNKRSAEDYIERIASNIRWHPDIQSRIDLRPITEGEYELILVKTAKEFLSLLDRKNRGGVQPFPFAVSILYLSDRAYGKAIRRKPILTQKLLAEAANSAEFTIRDHVYRFLGDLYKEHEEVLIDFIKGIIN